MENPTGIGGGNRKTTLDGENLAGHKTPLINDKTEHFVQVILGAAKDKIENTD
ncbi:MAG: hypothetical protein LH472_12090 [Pyrinomonadaceae bacterium]|nr:hypothetical protein [Pyrinomonadaceae bacterium]